MQRIIIKDLKARCIIGIKPEEKDNPQEVIVDLSLSLDLTNAAVSDEIEDTVDYDALSISVIKFIEKSRFNLLEKLAYETAKFIKEKSQAEQVKIFIRKPSAIKDARYAGVEITLD